MFFALSKILAFLLQPLNWIVLLLLLALFLRNAKWKKRMFYTGIGLLLFFTQPLIIYLALRWWEVKPVEKTAIPEQANTALVLGGYFRQNTLAPNDRFNLNDSPNRLINALELLNEGYVDQLVLSGGSGHLLYHLESESLLVDSLLQTWCWPDSVIHTESRSRNTYENIHYSKEVLAELDVETPVILITSAFHMRRAQAICRKQGLEVTPYPTDLFREELTWAPTDWLLPDAKALYIWNKVLKEWAGLIVYKMKGYAD